jgi:predicted transcriptional regulator
MEQASLVEIVKRMKETCNECTPISIMTCISGCSIWRMKNEFRDLHKKMEDADYVTRLLNALKNRKRLQVLETVSKNHTTISRLQQELKKLNHHHSQETIVEEYIGPLIDAGLAAHDVAEYSATLLGQRLSELTKRFPSFVEVLPRHSEGYDEMVLAALVRESKTHEALEELIPLGNVSRVLSRLESAGLVATSKENDYIFFFKTQREPNKESFSPTEKRVYENIHEEGIPARRLAERTDISLRRTYKYLRRLKGKKLIFTREKPKSYALTENGVQVATFLLGVQDLTREVLEASAQVLNGGRTSAFAATACDTESKTKGQPQA